MVFRRLMFFVLSFSFWSWAIPSRAQLGNSGSIEGVVKDASGGVVAGAKVEISNPVSGFRREVITGSDGSFRVTNVPFNPYHLAVSAEGFSSTTQDVDVRSTVPTTLQINLKVGTAATSITVEASGGDLVETESTFHTDVDQNYRQASVGERFVLVNVTGDTGVAGRGCGFQWQHARAGRPRGNFIFGGWPEDFRSNEQSVFQPALLGRGSVNGSDLWSAAGGIRG